MVATNLGNHKKNHSTNSKAHKHDESVMSHSQTENNKQTAPRENYFHCPCPIPVEAEKTGNPLTSHATKKFNHAVQSRSDYDQYWLRVYNGHSEKINYNLP